MRRMSVAGINPNPAVYRAVSHARVSPSRSRHRRLCEKLGWCGGGSVMLPVMTHRRYKTGTARDQLALLPARIEDYVPADAMVRAIDAYVDTLDLLALGFRYADGGHAQGKGQPPYHRGDQLKLYPGYLTVKLVRDLICPTRSRAERGRSLPFRREAVKLVRDLICPTRSRAERGRSLPFRREAVGRFGCISSFRCVDARVQSGGLRPPCFAAAHGRVGTNPWRGSARSAPA